MRYDALIVGGGMAGLTAAAYLSSSGSKVAVIEKEDKLGGLVNSFNFNGFTFDGGIRAIENSGIIMPMLRQLGIEVEFVKNHVSIGIEDDIVRLTSEDSLEDYRDLLIRQFPDHISDVERIIAEIRRVMDYMDVLYGIDNPLFLDMKKDREYLLKTILPWVFKYIFTINKIQRLNAPIDQYMKTFTQNPILIDMIAQHFFAETPAFFALSYFSLYLDYQYPKGGTGMLAKKMEEFVLAHGAEIFTSTEVCYVDPENHIVTDIQGQSYAYKKLIWAADLKRFYRMLDISAISSGKTQDIVSKQKTNVMDKVGGDSILTLYLTLDMDKSYFEDICSPHFFYTPKKQGLHQCALSLLKNSDVGDHTFTDDPLSIMEWVQRYLDLTTYEISFPVMRNEQLAPAGKTGVIISTLFDYSLVKHILELGLYEDFKDQSKNMIIDLLDSTVFPGIKYNVIDQFVSTPLTIETRTGSSEGAITGWAFTNPTIPVINKLTKIAQSILTPVPDVFQAGQWSYSPSGLPISVLTGKLAADKVLKELK